MGRNETAVRTISIELKCLLGSYMELLTKHIHIYGEETDNFKLITDYLMLHHSKRNDNLNRTQIPLNHCIDFVSCCCCRDGSFGGKHRKAELVVCAVSNDPI